MKSISKTQTHGKDDDKKKETEAENEEDLAFIDDGPSDENNPCLLLER